MQAVKPDEFSAEQWQQILETGVASKEQWQRIFEKTVATFEKQAGVPLQRVLAFHLVFELKKRLPELTSLFDEWLEAIKIGDDATHAKCYAAYLTAILPKQP